MAEKSHIDRLLEGLHHTLAMLKIMEREDRKFQVNARLDSVSFIMLEKLSTDFDQARSGLAADILSAALYDLWAKDGRLPVLEDESLRDEFRKFLEQE